MWNPIFEADEVASGTLEGWHRTFCLRLIAGRGTASLPGSMLALKEGGSTSGLAFRLPEARLHEELELLWKREMITGCYLPTWCALTLEDGRSVTALAFIMDPRHPLYESDSCPDAIAPLIAAASGPLAATRNIFFAGAGAGEARHGRGELKPSGASGARATGGRALRAGLTTGLAACRSTPQKRISCPDSAARCPAYQSPATARAGT